MGQVLDGSCLIVKYLLGVVEKALWAEISQVEEVSIIVFEIPIRFILLVCLIEIKCIHFIVNRQHGLWVYRHDGKVWWFALVSGSGANNVAHTNLFLLNHIGNDLILLFVNV